MVDLQEFAYLLDEKFGDGKGYDYSITSTAEKSNIPYPKGHVAFDEQNTIVLPAVGATSTILSFTVPDGYDGIINLISNSFLGGGFTPSNQDIVWRLLADDRPIRNFENIYAQKGSLEIPRPVNGIRIYSGQVITFTVTHAANVVLTGDVAASLSGYYYPAINE